MSDNISQGDHQYAMGRLEEKLEAELTKTKAERDRLRAIVDQICGHVIPTALGEYLCQYIEDDDGNSLPLLDVLTPTGGLLTVGKAEMALLADHLAGAVWDTVFKRHPKIIAEAVKENVQ